MGKVQKFPGLKVRKITGGKDPIRLVEELILRLGFEPEECLKDKDTENVRWMLPVSDETELEVLAEGVQKPVEATIYLGVAVAIVPLRGMQEFLITALEVADGLVGSKISLVGHFLILSASLGLVDSTVEDLEYHFRLILAQQEWFRNSLAEELDWEPLAED